MPHTVKESNAIVRESSNEEDDNFVTMKKRIGGGFKYVKVKIEGKKNVPEKHETETKEAEDDHDEKADSVKESDHETSPTASLDDLRLPLSHPENSCLPEVRYDDHPILRHIQDSVIGNNLTFNGPFGTKKLTYCDYTASGRSLSFIEDYIRTFVCPFYANTHSEAGRNARQTGKFREEARSIIKKCVNASKDDVVIFTGSGATSGLHKLAWALKINTPRVSSETAVFIGPYEHHANILLWKEYGATVVRIKDVDNGPLDLDQLHAELKFWKEKKRYLLVCISAASNVTGITTDTDGVARMAHKFGAIVAFDYAGGGPYLDINMNPSKQTYKDAVFISPHKFVGGPGSPGVLVAKKWLFRNSVPDRVGGGTVSFVTRDTHLYTSDIEAREEGGTPAIIESVRTGLAFQLKAAVGEGLIAARDEDLCCRAFSTWERNPNLIVLGSHTAERVTIFSFVVTHAETGKMVHHNFVATVLNDLFGIQSRGGCACAGPYGLDLFGISEAFGKRLSNFLYPNDNQTSFSGILKPGFCRINLPYFYDDETVDYIITAVDMVATYGWKLLPQYTFEHASGNFMYKGDNSENEDELFSLLDIDYSNNDKFHVNRNPPNTDKSDVTFVDMMAYAESVFLDDEDLKKPRFSSATKILIDQIPKEKGKFRWFLTPQEASDIQNGTRKVKFHKSFLKPRKIHRDSETDSGYETQVSQSNERSVKSYDRKQDKFHLPPMENKHPYLNETFPNPDRNGHAKDRTPRDFQKSHNKEYPGQLSYREIKEQKNALRETQSFTHKNQYSKFMDKNGRVVKPQQRLKLPNLP